MWSIRTQLHSAKKKNLISRINIWNEIIIFLPQVQLGHVCTGKGILIHWKLKKGGSKKEKTGRAFLSGKLKSAFRYHPVKFYWIITWLVTELCEWFSRIVELYKSFHISHRAMDATFCKVHWLTRKFFKFSMMDVVIFVKFNN